MTCPLNIFGTRHASERTVVAYDTLKDRILTASTDGKIRVYAGKDDPNAMEYVLGEPINCLLCKDEVVIVGTEGSHVYLQHIENGLLDGVATRFTAGVNCLATNRDKTRLLAGSSDFDVKLIDLSSTDATSREVLFKGHTGPILSVDFDPLGAFAATSSCDGTVRIWRISDATEVKCLHVLPKFCDAQFATSRCKLKWDPANGEFLAVPVENLIQIYSRHSNWKLIRLFESSAVEKPLLECEFSPDHEMVSALSADGWLVIWNSKDATLLYSARNPVFGNVCSMIWPQNYTIYCTDKFGALGSISIKPSALESVVEIADAEANTGLTSTGIRDLFGDSDSVDFAELVNIASDQAEEEAALSSAELEAEASTEEMEALNKGTGKKVTFLTSSPGEKRGDIDDDDDDDSNTIAISKIKSSFMRDVDMDDDICADDLPISSAQSDALESKVQTAQATASQVPMDIKPFQPGSMPSGFRERFLVWNHVGIVTYYEGEETDAILNASIEVEFHDTSLHHSMHLDAQDYTMAALNETALMLASPGRADTCLIDAFDSGKTLEHSDLSTILVRPLDTTGLGRESTSSTLSDWKVNLPPGESCLAIALVLGDGENFAVAATSSRLLRIFLQPASTAVDGASLQLLQMTSLGLPPISLPGRDIVTMACHPFLPILAVVVGLNSEELYWRVFNLSTNNAAPRGWAFGRLMSTFYPLPLSPSATLVWLGFSDVGNLFTHDSAGCLRRLTHQNLLGAPQAMDFHWVPVCDTRRCIKPQNRLSDCFFVVAVIEGIHQPTSEKGKNLGEDENVTEAGNIERIRGDELGFGQVQAIYCKASRWPRPIPRPILSSLPFRLQLCGVYETDQGTLEEHYLRSLVLDQRPFWGVYGEVEESISAARLKSRRRTLLRLFALASKLDNDWAAVAVAGLMPDVETVRLAIRYALRLNRSGLATRIGQIALAMEENEVAVEEEDQSDRQRSSLEASDNEEEREVGEYVGEVLGSECDVDNDDPGEMEMEGEEGENKPSKLPSSHTASPLDTCLTTESQASIQHSRLNPFKRKLGEEQKQQFGGRGSRVLDELTSQQIRPLQPARTNVPAGGGKNWSVRPNSKPSSRTKSRNPEKSDRPPMKRPSGEVSERAAKRLSAFQCSQEKT